MKTIKIQNSFAKIMKVWWPGGSSFQTWNFTGKSLTRLIWERCALAALLLPLILLTNATVQAQAFLEWAKQAGGSSGDGAYSIAVDNSGNSYVTGDFGGTATFGGTILTSPNANDIFVAKYSSAGDLIWAKRAGGLGDNAGRAIAVDASGNCYVTGDFRGNATFGVGEINETTLMNANDHNIFVAKYDPNGNLEWAKEAGGSGDDRGFGIGVDASANSYVTGYFEVTSTFEPGTDLTSAGDHDIFVAKYNIAGDLVWAKKAGGSGDDRGRGIAVDGSGNSYLTSFFEGSATFGAGEVNETILESAGFLDIYVAKYNGSGDLMWAKRAGGSGSTSNDVGFGIAVDVNGNSYVTGFFPGSATFGLDELEQTTLTSTGDIDIFVAKYNSSGDLVWAKKAGGSGGDMGAGIAVDVNGNSYVTGYFEGSATFGGTTLTSAGGGDLFVVKYNSSGILEWVKQSNSSSSDYWVLGVGIAVDPSGNSYVTGFFSGSATFGGATLTSAGDRDIFVAKFGQGTQSAIYVWRDPTPGRNGTPIDLTEAQKLADFAVAEGIRTIYYDNFGCGALSSPGCPEGAEAQNPSTLAPIISLLHSHSLKVEALYTDNTRIPDLVSYNNSVAAEARFDAIRLDIEAFPSGASEPTTSGDIDVYANAVASAGALPVYVSIGHSWDHLIAYPLPTDPQKEAFKHILDIVAGVDVQTAQDNSGTGPDARAIERITKEEVCYANSLNKRVNITIETYDVVTNLGLNDFNTFFDEGEAAMKNTLATLDWTAPEVAAPCANPQPTGFAYHFYRHSFGTAYFARPPIPFAGLNWVVRHAYNEGPQSNNWSASPQSVWVDDAGLHLKLRYDAVKGRWYSAEVYTDDFNYSKYGLHRFNITTPAGQPLLDDLDKNVVLGLFLSRDYNEYSVDDANVPFEIDIEFAKWGTARTANVDYTVWHHFHEPSLDFDRRTVPDTMNLAGVSLTSHFIDWEPSMVRFRSYKGHDPSPAQQDSLFEWNTTDDPIPLPADSIPKQEKNLRVHMNLWSINSNPLTVGDPPSDYNEVEIIVQDVIFPDNDNDGIFYEVDTAPNTFSNVFSDGTTTGEIKERGGQILTIVDSPYPNKGVVITAESSGGSNVANIEMNSSPCAITPSTFPPSSFSLIAGNQVVVTCGSITIEVLSGPVEITFVAADGTPATTALSTGNTVTFDPITFTFTTPATNAVPTVILVNETEFTMLPGETITIAEFETFDAGVEIGEDEFEVEGSFTLVATSNGINPLTEDITLEVGTYATTIPAGSFEFDDESFEFEGVIAGVALGMSITPLGGNEFNFMVIGEGADLTGTFNPVTVSLRIKDDAGTASIMADWYCGNNNNKVVICHNGHTLCINGNALPAHLNHGDYTGPCIPSGSQNLMVPGGITSTTPFGAVELEVFPNPAKNEVNIHLHGVETATELTIYDQLGKVVWTRIMEEGQISTSISLDNSRFGNGIYFVSAITKGEKISRRLVIVR